MTEQEKHLTKKTIISERESLYRDFEREFDVGIDLTQGIVIYKFFYRVRGAQADLLGSYAGDSLTVNEDSERDRVAAKCGSSALNIAKEHIQNFHPEIEEFIIQPEELRIGGVYEPEFIAWGRQDTKREYCK